jgi:hypothetical protein
MTFQRLKAVDWLWLVATLAVGRAWVYFDQDLLPAGLLVPAFCLLVLLLMAGYFALVRPREPFALARTVAAALGAAVFVLIVVQHVIVTFDLTYRAGIILGTTVLFPFVVAAGYKWVNR